MVRIKGVFACAYVNKIFTTIYSTVRVELVELKIGTYVFS